MSRPSSIPFFWLVALLALVGGGAWVRSTQTATAAPLAGVSLSSALPLYTQNFDTLASTGTSSTVPAGWAFVETGTAANTTYAAGTGSDTAGNTYSFGAAAAADRAFGGLLSGSVVPTIGGEFTNADPTEAITTLAIAYTGEQWRLGALGRVDRLDFQYSTNATSLNTGTWTDVNTLDFTAPVTTAPLNAVDGNAAAYRTAISSTITGLSIAPGASVWIRWNDFNATGSDDGLAVDNFSITAGFVAVPTPTQTSTPTVTPTPTTVPGNACGDPATPIYAIQGSGAASPDDGVIRTIEGVVVGDYQGATSMNGFNLQDIVGDDNPATSDGIFVFAASAPDVNMGDVVRVTGTVDEYFTLTEMTNVTQTIICGTAPIPTPVAINLPVAAISDLERYEGMYITFPQTLYVTEVFGVGRYGEVGLSVQSRRFQPTNYVQPGAPANAAQSLNDRSRILLDDNSTIQNPAVVPYLGADTTLRPNDTTVGLIGTLTYAFDFYRVYPTQAVNFTRANPRDLTPAAVGGTVQIASFNVLNYFTTIDNGSNDARGADSAAEFTRQRDKTIAAIRGLDADIIGLIELENNTAALNDLLTGINAGNPQPYSIAPGYPATIGTDAIKVGIIYRAAVVTPVGNAVIDTNAINNRPTVAQTFEQNGHRFTVVINHFKSKGCGGATGGDLDLGDGQSCFNATRIQQANRLLVFLNQIATNVSDSDFVLLGDFNAYAQEDPLDILKAASYLDLSGELLSPEEQYSYVFMGQSGELDHGFINPALFANVAGFTIWHINSDEPIDLDYNDNVLTSGEGPADFNQPYLYQPNAFRSSDHDPLLIGLDLRDADYSDAPLSYGIAYHAAPRAYHLGTLVDNDTSSGNNDDNLTDDGILVAATQVTAIVAGPPGGQAWLTGWADLNNDGDFNDVGERIVNRLVNVGANIIPLSGVLPTTNVQFRFRLYESTTEPLQFSPDVALSSGAVTGGEVEDYNIAPLAAEMGVFEANPAVDGIRLTWETLSEVETVGFHVWRATTPAAPAERLTTELIPAQTPGGTGAVYNWLDSNVSEGTTYYYWLDVVDTANGVSQYGPVSATMSSPTAITAVSLTAAPRTNVGGMALLALVGVVAAGLLLRRRR